MTAATTAVMTIMLSLGTSMIPAIPRYVIVSPTHPEVIDTENDTENLSKRYLSKAMQFNMFMSQKKTNKHV